MTFNRARAVIVVICAAAIGAAMFRVVNGPDRARERRDTARTVCQKSGGVWVKVDGDELCQPAPAPRRSSVSYLR